MEPLAEICRKLFAFVFELSFVSGQASRTRTKTPPDEFAQRLRWNLLSDADQSIDLSVLSGGIRRNGINRSREQLIFKHIVNHGRFRRFPFWWLILSEGVGLLRHKLSKKTMVWINRTAGIIIAIFGIWSLTTLLLA